MVEWNTRAIRRKAEIVPGEGLVVDRLEEDTIHFAEAEEKLAKKDEEILTLHQALLERCKYGNTYGCEEHSHDICAGCPLPKKKRDV